MFQVSRHLKKQGKQLPPYLATIEAQKKPSSCGNPHIHLVFVGASRLLDWRKLAQYWGKGFVYINRDGHGKKVRSPISYITKYITKTFSDNNADNTLTQSLVWLFNVKSYTCSRGLIAPLYPSGCGDWYATYFISVSPQENYFAEVDLMNKYVYDLYASPG